MTTLRFYEHFATAFGTAMLLLLLVYAETGGIPIPLGGGVVVVIGSLIYAVYRRREALQATTILPVREIEAACGLRYPVEFLNRLQRFSSDLANGDYIAVVPGAAFLGEVPEVMKARKGLPGGLLPFMATSGDSPLIYALDTTSRISPDRVVACAQGSAVADWVTFDVFLNWLTSGEADGLPMSGKERGLKPAAVE